jgi:hypothetical protein
MPFCHEEVNLKYLTNLGQTRARNLKTSVGSGFDGALRSLAPERALADDGVPRSSGRENLALGDGDGSHAPSAGRAANRVHLVAVFGDMAGHSGDVGACELDVVPVVVADADAGPSHALHADALARLNPAGVALDVVQVLDGVADLVHVCPSTPFAVVLAPVSSGLEKPTGNKCRVFGGLLKVTIFICVGFLLVDRETGMVNLNLSLNILKTIAPNHNRGLAWDDDTFPTNFTDRQGRRSRYAWADGRRSRRSGKVEDKKVRPHLS